MSPPAFSGRNELAHHFCSTALIAPLDAARTAQRAVPANAGFASRHSHVRSIGRKGRDIAPAMSPPALSGRNELAHHFGSTALIAPLDAAWTARRAVPTNPREQAYFFSAFADGMTGRTMCDGCLRS